MPMLRRFRFRSPLVVAPKQIPGQKESLRPLKTPKKVKQDVHLFNFSAKHHHPIFFFSLHVVFPTSNQTIIIIF